MRLSTLIPIAALSMMATACNREAAAPPATNDAAAGNMAATNAAAAPADTRPAANHVALASEAKSGDEARAVQKMRHDKFEDMGRAMKSLTNEAKKDTPNIAAVRASADKIALLSAELPGWFNPGTGPEAGKTEARAEIWKNAADFGAKATEFNRTALALKASVDSPTADVAAFKAGVQALGGTCKACHTNYRLED